MDTATFTFRNALIPSRAISMCFQVSSFKQHDDDAKILSKQFGDNELMRVTKLKRGEYIWSNGFENKRGKVF
jgi:hypothetical protein